MNLERGFRRITLFLSIVVGLGAWFLCFVFIFSSWDSERYRYSRYKDDYDNISYFWTVWDANGWVAGKRGIIQHLLEQDYAQFEKGDGTVYIDSSDVFPGIHKDMLNMPLHTLDEKAKTAKEQALKTAEKKPESHERWGNKPLSEIICLSIVAALPAGVIGFLIVWFLFFLLRWFVRGFCREKK